MAAEPKVSIVIPVYNGANYLHEAINCALAQTYLNTEVVVVNDGSNDDGETERIALSYGDRIRYFAKENGGVATALNLGLEKMTGDYFSWLSHDDMYTPDKIEKQIKALRQFGEQAVVFSDYCHISPTGKLLHTYRVSPHGTSNTRALLAISYEVGFHGCAFLIPRQYFDRFGVFNPALRYTQDADMWFRMAGNVPFIHVKEVLVRSRQHEEQDSQKHRDGFLLEADRVMSRMIRDLTMEEVGLYSGQSYTYLESKFHSFMKTGFEKSAYRLLKHLCSSTMAPKEIEMVSNLIQANAGIKEINHSPCHWERNLYPLLTKKKSKPRIVVYSGVWIRGGGERVLSAITETLKDKYDWYIVSNDLLNKEGFPIAKEITHIRLKVGTMENLCTQLAVVCSLLDADLFMASPNFDINLLPIYEKLRGLEIRSIACNFGHYFLPYIIEDLYPIIERRTEAFSQASAVTWLTSFSANVYAQLNDNGALLPTPNTFPKSSVKAPKDKKVVLSVGRFNDPIKRLDRILKVFAKVLTSQPDAELHLVGPYKLNVRTDSRSKETIGELIARLRIPKDKMLFVGEQENVEPFYMKASVLLLTSESEGIPMVLNEAGTFGLPCVISDISGLEDMITDGESGYIVPQEDLDLMASKVSALLSDFDLRDRMGNRAYELVERFARQRICERWERLMDTVLSVKGQDELNSILNDRFMEPPAHYESFSRKVIREYERNISLVIENKGAHNVPQPRLETDLDSHLEIAAEIEGNFRASIHAEAYQQAAQEFSNTVSWRVTRPLRWCKRFYVSARERLTRNE
ncbi:glycosyltransferase [Cohnella terricola]|uniref:Glycosyltransferase n=1 Tax=Cohnella terricola TaxID=1289167 RepID=A0A559JTD2_9BACL|nr:glycosyltransferase [Cohnella terricola]TVY03139.1 glycosyltransferase [Cohnella terricola]